MTRLAIIGFGAVAEHHLKVFRALGAEVVASCNRSEEGRARAARAGIPRQYSDPLKLAETESPDGFVVSVSALSLFETAKALIPTGRPILLEKPPGTSLAEAQTLEELARRHGTPVMVGLNRRFYSVFHRALRMIGGREAITAISVEWSEDCDRMLALGHPEALLSRLVFANSLHGIDLISFLGGGAPLGETWGRNLDTSKERLRWQMGTSGVTCTGVRARFESTWDVPGRWRLVVDAANHRWTSSPLETVLLGRKGLPDLTITPDEPDLHFKPGFHGQGAHFVGVIRGELGISWPACGLTDVLPAMDVATRLTEACL